MKTRYLFKMLTEAQEQIAFINYVRLKHHSFIIFAIPNGGKRNLNEAAHLKRQGVLAGVPDLQILMPNDMVFVEMKRSKGGRLSTHQDNFITAAKELTHTVLVGYGCKDAITKLEKYLKEKHEKS